MRGSTAILSVATVVLAATSIWSWRALVRERERPLSLQPCAESAERQPPDSPTALGAISSSVPGDVDLPGETGLTASPSPEKLIDARERLAMKNEAYRDARRRVRQLEMARGHVDLAKALGISQETADRLIALLVDDELEYLGQAHPNPRNEKELRLRQMENQQAQYEQDAGIAALIGAANLPNWNQYRSSLGTRHQVYQLGARLFADGHPLREDQIEPLIAVIHPERQRARRELFEYRDSLTWTDGMEEQSQVYLNERDAVLTKAAHQRIHRGASSILSPAQLEALDELMSRERELDDAGFLATRIYVETGRVSGEAN